MWPLVASVVSAVLMWAAFPPLDIGVLAFIAPAPFLWALRTVEKASHAFLLSALWGTIFFGSLLYWISVLGMVAWIPLTIWMAITGVVYGLMVWAVRLWPAWRWWLIAVGGWAFIEFLRTRFPFGGFPWGTLGHPAATAPGGLGAVQWIGPAGWSVLAVACAAGLILVIENLSNWRYLIDPAAITLLLLIGGGILAPSADGEPLRVAIIQGNSPCPQTHCQNENKRIFESHLAVTQDVRPNEADLVVWPENSTGSPYEPRSNAEVREAIVAEAERLDAYILVSGTRVESDEEFSNVNLVLSPTGVSLGEYAKQHPVPFGEYVPLRSLLGFIPQLDQVPRDMIRGEGQVVFPLPTGKLGSLISFEGAFAGQFREVVREGSQMIVVATNESSYGDSPASDQLIGIVRVNAAATGTPVIHAAITGKSTLIDADGSLGPATALLETRSLIGVLNWRNAGGTVYTRVGDWLQAIAIIAAVVAFAIPSEERTQSRTVPIRGHDESVNHTSVF